MPKNASQSPQPPSWLREKISGAFSLWREGLCFASAAWGAELSGVYCGVIGINVNTVVVSWGFIVVLQSLIVVLLFGEVFFLKTYLMPY